MRSKKPPAALFPVLQDHPAQGHSLRPVPDAESRCGCGKPAVHFRRYEGRHYCASCFCESVERRVKRAVAKFRMVQPGDRIVFGLSGGKDSSVLLWILHSFLKKRRDITMAAVTIDEGIAGYRSETIGKARELCKRLGIAHKTSSYKTVLGKTLDQRLREAKRKEGTGEACTFCGVARRYLLNKAAREMGATKLCVGHNLDDEVQSILMNYIRGDLIRASRLGPVTEAAARMGQGKFVPRIKPLRSIPEQEVMLYAILKQLPFSDKECPYATGVRFDVQEFFNRVEAKHPGMKYAFLESFDKLLPVIRKSVASKEPELQECRSCGEPSAHPVCKACGLWR